MKHFTHFFRVLTLCLVTLVSSGAWATVQTYQKVTSAPTDWSGEYLIVYEAGNCAMNGSLTTLDGVSNFQSVTITDNAISLDDSYSFTIAPMDGGYSIQAKSGTYMGNASNSNGLTSSDAAMVNTLSLTADGDVLIVSGGGAYLRYNATSGQTRFRYFRSSSYTNQKAIHLYKKSTTPPTDVLKSLTVSGAPTKTTYEAGEEFDPAGLTVTGTYSESGNKTVTSDITWTFDPATLTVGTTSVSVTAKVGSVESSEYIVNGLTVNAPKTLTSIAVSGTPIKTSYYVGAKLDVAGLVATGTYSDGSTEDLTDVATWNFTPAIFDATGNVAVAVVATVEEISSPAYNVNVTVAEKPAPTYANTYTSGEGLLTTTGGTSASAAKVVIDETQYEAIKAGTGKVAGAIKMTVPAGTKTLHFHALGWNGETVEITVNGQTYSLTSDTGVSGNSPFTLTTDPSEVGYFTLDTNNATALEITFAATSDNRFVLFGVNAEANTSTSIAADDVEIAADATSGEIAYTITNPVEGQTLSASTEATWISNIQVTGEKVTFTTTANTGAERTTTITLKYEGADDKDVTVTQAKAVIQYTITWSVNGETRQETYAEGEAINFAPATVPAGFTDYVFRGWITNATVEGTTEPTYVTEATATADVTYYAVFAKKTTTGGSGNYELVTENQSDWSGDYLIAYSEYVFADGREGGDKKMGAASSSVAPGENLSNNTVAASWGDQYKVALEEVSEGSGTYVLVTQDGKYNYYTSNSANGLSATDDKETAAKYPISVNFVSASDVQLALGGAATGSIFHYNNTKTGQMFRFYKNGGQSPVYLYKKQAGTVTYSDFCTILPAGLPVVIGSTGYATFYDRDNRIIPTGVKAYYCTQGEEGVLNTVQITNLSYIPRWTGVILEGTPGTYYLEEIPTIMADEEETDKIMDDNVLNGTLDDMSVEDLRAELGDYLVYVLSKVDGRIGFYKFAGDTLAGRKAFYVNANALVSGFILDFGMETVGVSTVVNATNLKTTYDLTGRKVVKSGPHGIFLQKGRKLIR